LTGGAISRRLRGTRRLNSLPNGAGGCGSSGSRWRRCRCSTRWSTRAPEALRLAHTYGTNGVVVELELALGPAQAWDEYLLAFPDGASAFSRAQELA